MFLVRGTWISDFLDEIVAFPEGQYKDQTDTVSASVSILNEMKDRKRFTLPTLAGVRTRN